MDPVSIGVAVAAAAAVKAAEGFTGKAGENAWDAVQTMIGRVRQRLTPDGVTALDRLGSHRDDLEAAATVAGEVMAAAQDDPVLRQELEGLITRIQQDQGAATVIARAYDQAKQVIITGPQTGTINM